MISRTKFDKLQSVVNYILLVSVLCTGMRLVPVIAIFFLSLLVADFIVLARQMPLTHVSRFRNLKRRLKGYCQISYVVSMVTRLYLRCDTLSDTTASAGTRTCSERSKARARRSMCRFLFCSSRERCHLLVQTS